MSSASSQGQAVVPSRQTFVYKKAPKFYIEFYDQYGNGERRTARGSRVCEYGGYVTVLDHDDKVVLAVKINNVICFGKV